MHIYRKTVAACASAAAILGVATAALAVSGTQSTNGSGTPTTANHPKVRAFGHHRLLRHLVHGEIVTHGKNGYVTHSGIRGKASAVSATAIAVRAGDGFSQTFTITKDTRVRERTPGKVRAKPGAISDVKTGDLVAVLGKAPESSRGNATATIVVDGLRK